MCGRFTLTSDGKDLMDYLEVDRWNSDFIWKPSYNIAPTQETPVLTYNNKRIIQGMHWGLVPNWSKDMKYTDKLKVIISSKEFIDFIVASSRWCIAPFIKIKFGLNFIR